MQSIINQNKGENRSVGSNPTPSECYSHNDLRREEITAVTNQDWNPSGQQLAEIISRKPARDASGHVWHPVAAVNRAWARQAVDLGWVK